MIFMTIIILTWVIYAFVMKKRLGDMFRFHEPLLTLVILSVVASLGLGINYVAAAIPSLNDGIGIHNFLAYWIIGEDNWSIRIFKSYFEYSLSVCLVLLIVYAGLKIVRN